MNDLSNTVYRYYCEHFDELSADKQLHFASRLFLWSADQFGEQKLAALRARVTHHDDPTAALRSVYDEAVKTIHHGSKNAAELRAPYFEKYPKLRAVAMVLFRLTFLDSIYGLDARPTLFEIFPKEELEELMQQLLADKEALAILSTHAINVLYLYHRVVLRSDTSLDPAQFLEVGATQYDLTDPIHLQLYIYLYTHCIIGESKFYARTLPEHYSPTYHAMLKELEDTIEAYFEGINLDNKFEFLVCCKLVGYESRLHERIMAEATQSVSTEGDWLVDRHNTNPQTTNSSLDLSEHRNVLFVMANRPKV
ncbi:MAG TPA: hypothetical protein VN031_00010 [Candidatus Microsaccharimonas sp.]|nr:hypothetical protein [Candidatus Microsaccharimonas sp.]